MLQLLDVRERTRTQVSDEAEGWQGTMDLWCELWDLEILYLHTCMCLQPHTHTRNFLWICVAFAWLHTIYPFLVTQPFSSGTAGLSPEVGDHVPLGGHIIPAVLTMWLVQKKSCDPIRAKVLSETVTYSLYVTLGPCVSWGLCLLIQKMMASLLPAPLGGSKSELKQFSKGPRHMVDIHLLLAVH